MIIENEELRRSILSEFFGVIPKKKFKDECFFNSLAEKRPIMVIMLSEYMGLHRGELREMFKLCKPDKVDILYILYHSSNREFILERYKYLKNS